MFYSLMLQPHTAVVSLHCRPGQCLALNLRKNVSRECGDLPVPNASSAKLGSQVLMQLVAAAAQGLGAAVVAPVQSQETTSLA